MELDVDEKGLGEALAKFAEGPSKRTEGTAKLTEVLVTALSVPALGTGSVVAGKVAGGAVKRLAAFIADDATTRMLAEGKRIEESRRQVAALKALVAESVEGVLASKDAEVGALIEQASSELGWKLQQLSAALQTLGRGLSRELEQLDQKSDELLAQGASTRAQLAEVAAQQGELLGQGQSADKKLEELAHQGAEALEQGQVSLEMLREIKAAVGSTTESAEPAEPLAEPAEAPQNLREGVVLDAAARQMLQTAVGAAPPQQRNLLSQLSVKAQKQQPLNPCALVGGLNRNLPLLASGGPERDTFLDAAYGLVYAVLLWAMQERPPLDIDGDEPVELDYGNPLMVAAAMWHAQGQTSGELRAHPRGPRSPEQLFSVGESREDGLLDCGPADADFLHSVEAVLWHRRNSTAGPYVAERDREALRKILQDRNPGAVGFDRARDRQQLKDRLEADAFEGRKPFVLLDSRDAEQWREVARALPEVTFVRSGARDWVCQGCRAGVLAQLVGRFLTLARKPG